VNARDYQNMAAELDAAIGARTGPANLPDQDGVILTKGSDVKAIPIAWLWHHWVALGKLIILAGAPGAGKTTIALAMASTLTRGARWPDGTACQLGNVLVWSGEDDVADTLAPRLIAMGADMSRVFFITGSRVDGQSLPFDPARDLLELDAQAQKIGDIRLVVVDPVVSAIAGDSHKNAEVRRSLQPLVDLGARLGAAVIGITHLSKGTAGRDPTERVTGSIAFSAVARIVLLAAKIKDDQGKDKRVLVRAKANICPDDGGFEYHVEQTEIEGGIPTSIVTWGQAIEGSAKALLAEAESDADSEEATGAMETAKTFLRELLTGPTPTKTVQAEAKDAGHSWASVRRASEALHVIKKKGADGWYWQLAQMPTRSVNLLTQKVEQHGQVEHVEQYEHGQDVQLAQGAHDFRVSNSEQVGDGATQVVQDAQVAHMLSVTTPEQVEGPEEVL
jgi:putative DNA primase/helicase